jgi:multicomponent Na+:H+ antiporter subunit C
MTAVEWFLWVGAAVTSLGVVRLLVGDDLVSRLVGLNVASAGTLMVLVALAARSATPDPVPHALALTGIVITVAVTGVGLALVAGLAADRPSSEDGER